MILRGKSIFIRPLCKEDKYDYCRVLSDPRVSQTLRGEVPGREGLTLLSECTQEELKLKFDQTLKRKIEGKSCFFAVTLSSTGRFIGSIGSYSINDDHLGLSYWLSAEYQGRGLGTEILEIYCDPALKYFVKKAVIANVAGDNPASAVAVQKAGFRQSNELKDVGFGLARCRDLFVWSKNHRNTYIG